MSAVAILEKTLLMVNSLAGKLRMEGFSVSYSRGRLCKTSERKSCSLFGHGAAGEPQVVVVALAGLDELIDRIPKSERGESDLEPVLVAGLVRR